ncbi:MAG: type III secretion system domain-containing protein [Kluyvera sp.]
MAKKAIVGPSPDKTLLQLHRYLWTPARYAHPGWLMSIGFTPRPRWGYGENPPLDRCLNRALQERRGTPRLPTSLNPRQQRIVQLSSRIQSFALATGLLELGCRDYFLLPDYRRVLLRWLDDGLLWQLFGLCKGNNRAIFSPVQTLENALELGTAVLNRTAQNDPVLHAVLITLPPSKRALWPTVPGLAMNLLEQTLCADFR